MKLDGVVSCRLGPIRTQFRLKGKSRDSYMELVLEFPLASIKSDEYLAEAQRVMDSLPAHYTFDSLYEQRNVANNGEVTIITF